MIEIQLTTHMLFIIPSRKLDSLSLHQKFKKKHNLWVVRKTHHNSRMQMHLCKMNSSLHNLPMKSSNNKLRLLSNNNKNNHSNKSKNCLLYLKLAHLKKTKWTGM
jgi:hypothetical protein